MVIDTHRKGVMITTAAANVKVAIGNTVIRVLITNAEIRESTVAAMIGTFIAVVIVAERVSTGIELVEEVSSNALEAREVPLFVSELVHPFYCQYECYCFRFIATKVNFFAESEASLKNFLAIPTVSLTNITLF